MLPMMNKSPETSVTIPDKSFQYSWLCINERTGELEHCLLAVISPNMQESVHRKWNEYQRILNKIDHK